MSKTIKEATIVEIKAELYDANVRIAQQQAYIQSLNEELAERAKVDAIPTMDKAPENNEEVKES